MNQLGSLKSSLNMYSFSPDKDKESSSGVLTSSYIHFFGKEEKGINKCKAQENQDKKLLGGKGAGLIQMTNLGINVPPGFVIDTSVCIDYYKNNGNFPDSFAGLIHNEIKNLECITGKKINDKQNILLLSVRSGAPVSMPGMMDTILNIGITKDNLLSIIEKFGIQFAYNSYLRFLECYSDIILNLDFKNLMIGDDIFVHYLDVLLRSESRFEFSKEKFEIAIEIFEKMIVDNGFADVLHDINQQIILAIKTVIKSYYGKRAKTYRAANNLDESMGTAVVIQSMVFGNLNKESGTGVVFSRNPSTGKNELFGEFMVCAQGEDVVSGICTPELINDEENKNSMKNLFPKLYDELFEVVKKLEKHFKDVQDVEFTIENQKLYILQSRSAKRCAEAELKIALDLLDEGFINEKEMLSRINYSSLSKLLHPVFANDKKLEVIAKGLAASPGCAVGCVVFDANDAAEASSAGKKVILVRTDTSPEDIIGMIAAEGILTARGGMTSHAAVVARGMGKPCVCGALDVFISPNLSKNGKKYCEISSSSLALSQRKKIIIEEGDKISINGGTGDIFLGEIDVREPEFDDSFLRILKIAENNSFIGVRANADNELDCNISLKFGAKGIGLCRTEHMFFADERILHIRNIIMTDDELSRKDSLAKIKEFQKNDFIKIFRKMHGLPVTIRLLDPPLHEFLPLTNDAINQFISKTGMRADLVKEKIESLTEKNPMLGHRGCRLAISHPDIYEAQIEAIFEAAFEILKEEQEAKKKNFSLEEIAKFIMPEIMIPLVAWEKECEILVNMIHSSAKRIFSKLLFEIEYKVGSMIELPRAALIADKIAKHVDFLSFGTNDLTQTTLGLSRDDMMNFLNDYNENGIIDEFSDPFVTIDIFVAELMKKACDLARMTKPEIKIGVCGEHGGDPRSIKIFKDMGVNYISVSPYRIPIGILAISKEL